MQVMRLFGPLEWLKLYDLLEVDLKSATKTTL